MKSEPNTAWRPSRPRRVRNNPPLIEALKAYDRLERRRFHVPAHAGHSLWLPDWDLIREPYRYDLSELDGLDVLSEPSGCIAEAQAATAEIFGVGHSFFLVNGASVGLMAAMLATVRPGDKVLLPRNVHRSVLSGLILSGAQPVWFLPAYLPEWGLWAGITVDMVREQLDCQPDIRAFFLTSPTYEGIGSDIESLASLCRERGVRLIVDEAHGGLWPFFEQPPAYATQAHGDLEPSLALETQVHGDLGLSPASATLTYGSLGSFLERLPVSATRMPCDAVIHSLHKTGGALTQGAVAHLPHASQIDPDVFQQALNTLQTTSPSYLLLASLDATCHHLDSEAGRDRIEAMLEQVFFLREELQSALNHLQLFEPEDRHAWDPCKLYFKSRSESGEDWGARVEAERRLAFESTSPFGVLYLANLGLTAEDFAFFKVAILAEDKQMAALEADADIGSEGSSGIPTAQTIMPDSPEMVLTPREAFFAPGEQVPVREAVGKVAKETVVHCPPGIPVLMPGERIREAHLPFLGRKELLVLR